MMSSIQSASRPTDQFIRVKNDSPEMEQVETHISKTLAPHYGKQERLIRKIKEGGDRRCEILQLATGVAVGVLSYAKELTSFDYESIKLKNSFKIYLLSLFKTDPSDTDKHLGYLIERIMKLANRNHAEMVHMIASETDQVVVSLLNSKEFSRYDVFEKKGDEPKFYLYAKSLLPSEINGQSRSQKRRHEDVPQEDLEERKTKEARYQSYEPPPQRRHSSYGTYSQNGYGGYSSSSSSTSYSYQPQQQYDQYGIPKVMSSRELARSRSESALVTKSTPSITHEITLKKEYIHQIKWSGKTIEGRVNQGMVLRFKEGDTIRFFYKQNESDDAICEITKIEKFKGFPEMLQRVGFQKCLPKIRDMASAINAYDAIPGYTQRAERFGVVAIHIKFLRSSG